MRIHDGFIGLFFIILGSFVILQAATFPAMPGQAIGPGTFPLIFGALFIVGGLIIGRSGVMAGMGKLGELNPGWRHPERAVAAAVAVLGTLFLAIFFEQIGFLLGGAALLIALYMLQGHRSLVWVVVSIGFVGAVYYGMAKLLLVPLPTGPLF